MAGRPSFTREQQLAIHARVCLAALAGAAFWSLPAVEAAEPPLLRLSQAPGADGPYLRRPDGSLYKPETYRPEKKPEPPTDQPTKPAPPEGEAIPQTTPQPRKP